VQNRKRQLDLHTTFSKNVSKVTKAHRATFQTGGFGTSLGTFQIEQDSSATQIFGRGKVATPIRLPDVVLE